MTTETVTALRYADVVNIDIPSYRDKNNWYAGGSLRDATYPGGINFSPVGLPSFDNKPQGLDQVGFMLSGNFEYLNRAMSSISSFMSGEFFDILNSVREKEARVLQIEVTVTQITGDHASGDGGFEYNATSTYYGTEIGKTENQFSLSEINMAVNGGTGLIGNIKSGAPLDIAVSVYNMLTGDKASFEQRAKAEGISYVKNQIISTFGVKLGQSIGLTTVSQLMGFTTLFGYAFQEFFEYAIGYDTAVGFGGELSQELSGKFGTPVYSQYQGILGTQTALEQLGFSLGLIDTVAYELGSRGTGVFGYDESSLIGSYSKMKTEKGIYEEVYGYESGLQEQLMSEDKLEAIAKEEPFTQSFITALEKVVEEQQAFLAEERAKAEAEAYSDYATEATGGDDNNSNTPGGYTGGDFGWGDGDGGFGGI